MSPTHDATIDLVVALVLAFVGFFVIATLL